MVFLSRWRKQILKKKKKKKKKKKAEKNEKGRNKEENVEPRGTINVEKVDGDRK